jgi:hypothetical protein
VATRDTHAAERIAVPRTPLTVRAHRAKPEFGPALKTDTRRLRVYSTLSLHRGITLRGARGGPFARRRPNLYGASI